MPRKTKDEAMTFEQALARLEEIVGTMESGEPGLDQMIAAFEEGAGLVKFCNERLDAIEKRIEVLVRRGDRDEAEPFRPPAEGAAPEG
ncbi:MAG: exodeoxyribonuclease VII small subunit [Lentisphaerae bacterium]|nr:exodeoxyribonuclease VII small subunit [Lentisphaerota bacterium]